MQHNSLTSKQRNVFNIILKHVKEADQWPTIQQLMDELGFRSPNSITQLYQALIDKHYIVKTGWGDYEVHPIQKFRLHDTGDDAGAGIPIVGRITAGGLQEAVEDDLGRVTLQSLLPGYENMRAVVVSGQSMKNAGITNGDIVLLARTEIFDGQIGAVRYRGETSLKRIYRTPSGMKLMPENDDFEPIMIYPGDFEDVQIIGRYVGHINEKGLHKA